MAGSVCYDINCNEFCFEQAEVVGKRLVVDEDIRN